MMRDQHSNLSSRPGWRPGQRECSGQSNDQHRNRGLSDHSFCGAADQDIGDAAAAVGAHDDEIAILFLGKRVDGGLRQVGCMQDFFDLDVRKRHFAYFFNIDKKEQPIFHLTRRTLRVNFLSSLCVLCVSAVKDRLLSPEIQIRQPQGDPGKQHDNA